MNHRLARVSLLCRIAPIVVAASSVAGASLAAQPVVKPVLATATVTGAFGVTPLQPTLTQTSQQGNPCNPGACFIGTLGVHANQRWQAQVRVIPTAPTNFYVNWVTQAPNQTLVRLSATWYTFTTGTTATINTPTALQFNANKATGPGGQTPTAAQLSGYLEFRVIALP